MLAQMSGMLGTVPRDVAQGVQLAIGGHQIGRGAGDDAADFLDDLANFFLVQIRAEAGNRFELVERAAGRAQAAAGDHRHFQPATGQQRRDDERRFIADAAGGVLIDHRAETGGPLERRAGAEHHVDQRGGFGRIHAAKEDGHRQGRHLIFGHFAADESAHEFGDFVGGERTAVTFFGDDGYGIHGAVAVAGV